MNTCVPTLQGASTTDQSSDATQVPLGEAGISWVLTGVRVRVTFRSRDDAKTATSLKCPPQHG